MAVHVFVDETKRREYALAAVAMPAESLAMARRRLRQLLLGNQRRIHFKDERADRKRQILHTIGELPFDARLYVCDAKSPELRARKMCLERLVRDLCEERAARLILETDESMLVHDRRVLFDSLAAAGCAGSLTYAHLRAHEEPLLWVADAVAWSWPQAAAWRALVQPIVTRVVRVA